MNKELLDELEKKYGFVGSIHNEFIIVEKDKKWGFINSEGEEVVSCKYDFALPFANGFALAEKNGEDGFIDKEKLDVWTPFNKSIKLTPMLRVLYSKYKDDYILTDFMFIGTLTDYKKKVNKEVYSVIAKEIMEEK